MRIAYVTRQYPPGSIGGIGIYVETVASAMAARGHDVSVVCANGTGTRSTETVDGVRIDRFPEVGPHRLWRVLARRSHPATARVVAALSAFRALRHQPAGFDVVEAPDWKAEGLLLSWARRGPVVVHLHLAHQLVRSWGAIGQRRGLGVRLAELLERRTVRRAAAVTATSARSSTMPDGSPWLAGLEVDVVAPPIRPETWADVPPARGTEPNVLFVGHLEQRKAPEVLVAALAQLAPALRTPPRVMFIGRAFTAPDGRSYDDFLHDAAADAGIECTVLPPAAGPATMGPLYEIARVVVVPSRYETLSMVALEGLASGRPVVMTEAVGAVEWIGDLGDRLVVPADDPDALATALRPLLADPLEAERLGERGRALVSDVCTADRIVNDRIATYERVRRHGADDR